MPIDREKVRRAFADKDTSELVGIWERHDPDEWRPEAFEIVREILHERGIPLPEISPAARRPVASRPRRSATWVDTACQGVALGICILGLGFFGVGMVTQASRIARDVFEDGIMPSFAYCLLTGLGVLRSFRPQLPRWFHQVAALANALMGIAVIMFWVYLLRGAFRPGTELIPLLMTVLYGVMLRATMIGSHFQPPFWGGMIVVALTTLAFWIPNLGRANAPLSVLNRRADVRGALIIAVTLAWALWLIVGFRRAPRVEA